MEVRRLTPEEWPVLKAARLRALREEPSAYWSTFEQEAAFGDTEWAARAADEAVLQLVAVGDGRGVVGLVGARREDEAVELFGMWVDPRARGRGVADALVQAVVEWAGAPVRLWVMAGNDRAERCYRRLGFERTVTEEAWFEMVRP